MFLFRNYNSALPHSNLSRISLSLPNQTSAHFLRQIPIGVQGEVYPRNPRALLYQPMYNYGMNFQKPFPESYSIQSVRAPADSTCTTLLPLIIQHLHSAT